LQQPLNFPNYNFKIRTESEQAKIFDVFRKKYIVLTPEEWVRQHLATYLVEEKKYAKGLIELEKSLSLNSMQKRADILISDRSGKPYLLAECKAPSVKITQDTFEQIARYNLVFKVPFLVVSNGLEHYSCQIDFDTNKITFLKEIPAFKD
jgi:type I site-specific restriction endonuclease